MPGTAQARGSPGPFLGSWWSLEGLGRVESGSQERCVGVRMQVVRDDLYGSIPRCLGEPGDSRDQVPDVLGSWDFSHDGSGHLSRLPA